MIWYQDFLYTHYFNKTIFLKGELLSTIFFSLYINDMPESFGSRVTEKSFNIGQARIISHGYRVDGLRVEITFGIMESDMDKVLYFNNDNGKKDYCSGQVYYDFIVST